MNRTRPPARGRRIARSVALVVLVPAMAVASAGAAFADVSGVAGSAFGESVDVHTALSITSGPTPTVTLPAGGSAAAVTDNAASANVLGLLTAGVLNVSTQGTPGPTGSVSSSATVANPKLGLAVAPVVSADAVGSSCTSNEQGSTGTTTVANVKILGIATAVSTAPNTTVNVLNVGILHVNEQVLTGSGASTGITVNALRLELNAPLGLGTGNIIIGQSKCAVTGEGVVVPTGAVGGVLLAGVVAAGFGVTQLRRRRRGEVQD